MFDGGHAPLSKASSKPSSHPAFLALVGRAVSNAGRAAAQAPRSVATPHATRSYSPGPSRPSASFAQRVGGRAALSVGGAVSNAANHTAASRRAAPNVVLSQGRAMLVANLMQELGRAKAYGFLPANLRMPNLIFDTKNNPNAAMYVDRMIGRGKSWAPNAIHVTPGYSQLTPQDSGLNSFIKQALLHETAHTRQSPAAASSKVTAEGGAQAWADAIGPYAIAPYYPVGDGSYRGYVGQVAAREGMPWVLHGQFNQHAPLPPINAPNTRAGQNAIQGVGGSARDTIVQVGNQVLLRHLEHLPGS